MRGAACLCRRAAAGDSLDCYLRVEAVGDDRRQVVGRQSNDQAARRRVEVLVLHLQDQPADSQARCRIDMRALVLDCNDVAQTIE
jgi:hypothetical protein